MDRRSERDDRYRERWKYMVYRLGDPMPDVPF